MGCLGCSLVRPAVEGQQAILYCCEGHREAYEEGRSPDELAVEAQGVLWRRFVPLRRCLTGPVEDTDEGYYDHVAGTPWDFVLRRVVRHADSGEVLQHDLPGWDEARWDGDRTRWQEELTPEGVDYQMVLTLLFDPKNGHDSDGGLIRFWTSVLPSWEE